MLTQTSSTFVLLLFVWLIGYLGEYSHNNFLLIDLVQSSL